MQILVIEDTIAHAELILRPLEGLGDVIKGDSLEDVKSNVPKKDSVACIILDLQIYLHTKQKREPFREFENENVDPENGLSALEYLVNEIGFPKNQILVTTIHNPFILEISKLIPADRIYIKPFSVRRMRKVVSDLLSSIR